MASSTPSITVWVVEGSFKNSRFCTAHVPGPVEPQLPSYEITADALIDVARVDFRVVYAGAIVAPSKSTCEALPRHQNRVVAAPEVAIAGIQVVVVVAYTSYVYFHIAAAGI